MKTRRLLLCLLAGLGAGTFAAADDVPAILSPTARKESLARAEALLSNKPLGLPLGATDPFHSQAFAIASGNVPQPVDTGPAKPVGPKSDHDILAGIAAGLKPNGIFVIGGEEVLLFGEKRVKAGSTLTINFEGASYTVEIAAVTHTSFTLRLNREEYTRPIK